MSHRISFLFIALMVVIPIYLWSQGLVISPDPINFGTVATGINTQIPVTVTNSDPFTYTNGIQTIVVSGTGFSYFCNPGPPFAIYDTPVSFDVIFTPPGPGPYSGTLTVIDFNYDAHNIPLSGICEAGPTGPVLGVNPDFYFHTMTELDYYQEAISFSNRGDGVLTFEIADDELPDWLWFGWSDLIGGKSVAMQTLAPGDSMTIPMHISTQDLLPGNYGWDVRIITNQTTGADVYWNVDLTVTYLPIRAFFAASDTTIHAGSEILFTDQTRFAPGDTLSFVSQWTWDMNGDGFTDAMVRNPLYTYNTPGVYTVSLTVLSNTGNSNKLTKYDYITVTNDAPVVIDPATTLSFNEDNNYSLMLRYVFSDPDNDPLTYLADSSQHISAQIVLPWTCVLTPASNWFGTENITITAIDPYGSMVSKTYTVTVLPVNDAPILNLPANFYFIRNSHYTIDFSQYVEDPDNPDSELSINMVQVAPINHDMISEYNPGWPGHLTATFHYTPDLFGSATINITFSDHVGRAVATGTFTITALEHFTVNFGTDNGNYYLCGQTVPFFDNTLGNPDWWHWDFENDGLTDSDLQNPSHVYYNSGTYSVRLTLGNLESGESATALIQDMFTMTGTAIDTTTVLPPVMVIEQSPYNIMGGLNFPVDQPVVVNPGVEVIFLAPEPIPVLGTLQATGASFRPPQGGGFWGGMIFGPGSGGANLLNCNILDAENPLVIDGSSPQLTGLEIATSDTTSIIEGEGLRIGNSSSLLNNIRISNYRTGIRINGGTNRNSPTLTNIRVRNSNETQRDLTDYTGIEVMGGGNPVIEDAEIENFGTAIKIENYDRETATPTLTNIRVRNSSETQRVNTTGILIRGAVQPELEDIEIDWMTVGIDYSGAAAPVNLRDTPTLTNIRVRNSSETQRTPSTGLLITDIPAIILSEIETVDLGTGIMITGSDIRAESTPTLTNIRVRNSSETLRTDDYGLVFSGHVIATVDDVITENCSVALLYDKSGPDSRTATTPTLTNIRVRNSSETQRSEKVGLKLFNLGRVLVENDSIGGCTTSIYIQNTSRETAKPTLTNIRVRNSSETQRVENVGIYLGSGVAGTLQDCDIRGALTGIVIAPGNQTKLGRNFIKNCGTGIRANSLNPQTIIRKQVFSLDPDIIQQFPLWTFRAFDILNSSFARLQNNTIYNYPVLVAAYNSDVRFNSNIGWAVAPIQQPFVSLSSTIEASYSDIYSPGLIFPGVGNLNQYPAFLDTAQDNFLLTSQSPCIDRGDPMLPDDEDGSRTDMGAYSYLHRAAMSSDYRFVTTGTTVHFVNESWGHDNLQLTVVNWDLNNDLEIDATSRDWTHTFNQPGIYSLRLKMQTGSLIDEVIYQAAIVVQDQLLQAPVIQELVQAQSNIVLNWNPVNQTVNGEPVFVNYYIVYGSDDPNGYFDFLGLTEAPLTQFIHQGGALADKGFYIVLGYAGTRSELELYLNSHPRIGGDGRPAPQIRRSEQ